MGFYVYHADVYCEECGNDLKRQMRKKGFKPDSCEWPEFEPNDSEADSPQHCGSGENCLDAFTLNAPIGQETKRTYGAFLENSLTSHGREYVKNEHKSNPTELTAFWVEFYGLENEINPRCDWCDAVMESCCDGIVRCLECEDCPACSDGPGYGMDDEDESEDD